MNSHASVVVPVYNEEEILVERMQFLLRELAGEFHDFEIILTENGSVDRTKELMRELEATHDPIVGLIDDDVADYGKAIVDGINACRFDEVVILELDYLDMGFLRQSFPLLGEYDLVIGSKKMSPGIDRRPWKRRLFTRGYNLLLKAMFRIPLTETHGLKSLRRSKLLDIANGCVTGHAVYPSELTIRAWLDESIRVCEIPLTMPLVEMRTTRITAAKRLKKTLQDLLLLRRAIKKPRQMNGSGNCGEDSRAVTDSIHRA